MSTLTVYSDSGTGSTTVDGWLTCGQSSWASFAAMRSASGSGAYPSAGVLYILFYDDSTTNAFLELRRSIFTFDTSSLTSSATISAATLSLYGNNKFDYGSYAPTIDIFAATPASNNNLVASDYANIGTTSQTGSAITYGNWNNGYNAFTFNSTGKGNISKTGVSRFGAREATYDAGGATPTWISNSGCGFAADSADGGNAPKLVITYTTPVAPTVTGSAASSVTASSMIGNGNITADGGATVTRRGFCYKTGVSGDPTTADSVAYDDGSFGTGAYTKSITGLTSGTSYRVRAYAVNSAGTSYGTTTQEATLSGPANVKTVDGIAAASVKTYCGVTYTSIKKVNGVA